MKITLTILSCFALTACTIPVTVNEVTIPPEERTEEDVAEPEQPEETEEHTERLLPTGILEVGERDAPITLLMFTEHHCRYCQDFQNEHFPELTKDFIDQNLLRLQIAILPLKKYEFSTPAAVALYCAGSQGKGLPMHSKLLSRRGNDRKMILAYAEELELDAKTFAECLDSETAVQKVDEQKSLARSLDVTLVPTFFLNGKKSVGLPYYPDLKGMIEAEIPRG